jgi:hypothetical protein
MVVLGCDCRALAATVVSLTSRDPCKARAFYFFGPGMVTDVLLQWVLLFMPDTVDGPVLFIPAGNV